MPREAPVTSTVCPSNRATASLPSPRPPMSGARYGDRAPTASLSATRGGRAGSERPSTPPPRATFRCNHLRFLTQFGTRIAFRNGMNSEMNIRQK